MLQMWSGFMTSAGWDTHRRLDLGEARWLLDVAREIGTTHAAVITELGGTTATVMDILTGEIEDRGMVPVLWTSKAFAQPWRIDEGLAYVRELARRYPGAVFDIGREADFLFQVHNRPEDEVVGYLWQLKAALMGVGVGEVAPDQIMAGGHTLAGAISIDRMGPGWITITGYAWVDKAYSLDPARWPELLASVVRDELLTLRARTNPAHRICVVEIGWPSSLGEDVQATVYRETLRGISESGVVDGVGYWQLPDFVHCGDEDGNMAGVPRCNAESISYGLLGPEGLPKAAFGEW